MKFGEMFHMCSVFIILIMFTWLKQRIRCKSLQINISIKGSSLPTGKIFLWYLLWYKNTKRPCDFLHRNNRDYFGTFLYRKCTEKFGTFFVQKLHRKIWHFFLAVHFPPPLPPHFWSDGSPLFVKRPALGHDIMTIKESKRSIFKQIQF